MIRLEMAESANKIATYDDLYNIPENMTGEIINGELVATPRPSRKHSNAISAISGELTPPYRFGRGGPGGWIILIEVEIGLGADILVPDLAGWKVERYPEEEPHNWISVAPDWICEVLSPGTVKRDKMEKMPIYARHGIPYLWVVDPLGKTLDAFRLQGGKWVVEGSYAEDARVRTEPFAEVEFDLNDLW